MLGAIGAGYCGSGSDNGKCKKVSSEWSPVGSAGTTRRFAPPPRVFCRKSVDLFDCKGVDFLGSDPFEAQGKKERATVCQDGS